MKNTTSWQSIEMLPVLEHRVQEILTEAEHQLDDLRTLRHRPDALDDATLQHLLETYETKANYLLSLREQALRWRQTEHVTERQKDLLTSLEYTLSLSEKVIQQVLTLAQHFLNGTLDSLIVTENMAWMTEILSGNAPVPEAFREEIRKLKREADTLTALQQQHIITIHHHIQRLEAINATEDEILEFLHPYLAEINMLLRQNKQDALLYYCCLYPGFHDAMQLLGMMERVAMGEETLAWI